MNGTGTMAAEPSWQKQLHARAEVVERFLTRSLAAAEIPPRLAEAMRYSLLAGGKRLRPVLCLSWALACAAPAPEDGCGSSGCGTPAGGLTQAVLPFAAGLEMIHTYSLIHDDLPAMDNDDLRRGRPTCHKAYDEATAILAGDALLTDAFDSMAATPLPADRVLTAVLLTARAAGSQGMVGGQVLDLAAEGHSLSVEELKVLNAKKTGALLRGACECGAVLAGADRERRAAARTYGLELGIAFQITDDILDVTGDEATVGKQVRHDAASGKATWPSLLGLDAARALAEEHCRMAEAALEPGLFSGAEAAFLRLTARELASRTR